MSKKWNHLIVLLTLVSLLLSACAGAVNTPMPATETDAPPPAEPATETAIPVATEPEGSSATPLGDTLTIAVANFPASLDPGKGTPVDEPFLTPAYDSLLRLDAEGNYQPLLAVSWKWADSEFKVFELELRPDVKFSDGSEFNAEAVKAWLELQKANNTPAAGNIGLDFAEVTGPLSIRLHLLQPNTLLPTFLTRNWISGIVACPAAVTDLELVATATCGTGPYMLDAATTVTADTYTYVPNPNYWNPAEIHWNKLVLKVVANPQAALDALRIGQVQVISPADASIIDAATADGMQLEGVELNVQGLIFLYKDGTSVPALEDVRVRQALNYAIDREALANVISAGKGRPVSSEFLPGSDAHDPALDNYYPYDVTKAQQLLDEAGYADGFELTILSLPFLGFDTLAQAVASYWEEIGVETTIESKATLPDFIGGLSSGEYAVAVAGLGATSPTVITWNCCIRPGSSWNPDTSEVPELQALIDQLSVTVVEDAPPVAQEVNQYLTENAWFVPVVATKLYFLYDSSVTGGSPTPAEPVLNTVEIKPAQ